MKNTLRFVPGAMKPEIGFVLGPRICYSIPNHEQNAERLPVYPASELSPLNPHRSLFAWPRRWFKPLLDQRAMHPRWGSRRRGQLLLTGGLSLCVLHAIAWAALGDAERAREVYVQPSSPSESPEVAGAVVRGDDLVSPSSPAPSERFVGSAEDAFDLDGTSITFVPDGFGDYSFRVDAISTLPTDVTLGLVLSVVSSGDDVDQKVGWSGPAFPYFGVGYSNFWVNSNGAITFDAGWRGGQGSAWPTFDAEADRAVVGRFEPWSIRGSASLLGWGSDRCIVRRGRRVQYR